MKPGIACQSGVEGIASLHDVQPFAGGGLCFPHGEGMAVKGGVACRIPPAYGGKDLLCRPFIMDIASRSGQPLRGAQFRGKEKVVHVEDVAVKELGAPGGKGGLARSAPAVHRCDDGAFIFP